MIDSLINRLRDSGSPFGWSVTDPVDIKRAWIAGATRLTVLGPVLATASGSGGGAQLMPDTGAEDLERTLAAASAAAGPYGDLRPSARGALLRRIAAALDDEADSLVQIADEDTHLGVARMRADLARTTSQLRLHAAAVERGGLLRVTVDEPTDWNGLPRPDLRRMLVPLGPVVVFAASNFPFSFSIAGGDTASALAAGCPVIVKAHPGHLRLSHRVGATVREALESAGAPVGTFAVVVGDEAGRQVLEDPRIAAGAFTGSTRVGRLLYDVASRRQQPIPFYGELGSTNPVFVTAAALEARREAVLSGYVDSFTFGAGQLCTKPGFLFVPAQAEVEDELVALVSARSAAPLLGQQIADAYRRGREELSAHPSIRTLVAGAEDGDGARPRPCCRSRRVASSGRATRWLTSASGRYR